MVRVYATTEQAWPTDPPANAALLLRTASRLVDVLLTTRAYDVDTEGLPTDPDDAQALQDAAVTIAHELQTTGALDSGSTEGWQSVGIGSVTLSGRQSTEGTTIVAGLPVPVVALVYLGAVGTHWVQS